MLLLLEHKVSKFPVWSPSSTDELYCSLQSCVPGQYSLSKYCYTVVIDDCKKTNLIDNMPGPAFEINGLYSCFELTVSPVRGRNPVMDTVLISTNVGAQTLTYRDLLLQAIKSNWLLVSEAGCVVYLSVPTDGDVWMCVWDEVTHSRRRLATLHSHFHTAANWRKCQFLVLTLMSYQMHHPCCPAHSPMYSHNRHWLYTPNSCSVWLQH